MYFSGALDGDASGIAGEVSNLTGGGGIDVTDSANVTFEHLWFHDLGHRGLSLESSSVLVRDVLIQAARYFGIFSQNGDVTLVEVEGQLIVGNRQELKQQVLEQLEGGDLKFVIDFANTGYIDSSGLGVLVSLSKKIREQGGELRLSSLNDDLRTLFELTKLDTLFRIADDKDQALSGF